MKILVTGATGFIGSHVLDKLVETGHAITATARDGNKAAKFSWFKKVRFIAFDLSGQVNSPNLYDSFDRPDILIHLAWEGLPNYRSQIHLERNYPFQQIFLNQMIKGGLSSLTVTGTCLEYGLQGGCLSENIPSKPIIAYAQAKQRLLESLLDLQTRQAFFLKWVRLFYTFGSGQSENSILSQLDKALERGDRSFNMSGGEQLRDYLPVEQMAEYIIKIALQDKVTGVINCCSGTPVSIKGFVEDYLNLKKKSINLNLGYYPYLDYEPMSFWGDVHKLKETINGK